MEVLRQFIAVAQRQSYTRAAKQLGMQQPNVSHNIIALEKEIGFKLFERTSRKVRLTEEGEIYYRHVLKALMEYDEGIRLVHVYQKVRPVVFTTENCRSHPSVRQIINMLSALAKRDGMLFRISAVGEDMLRSGDPADLLLAGDIDFAFLYDLEEVGAPRYIAEPVFDERMLICVRSDSSFDHGQAVTLGELSEFEFISPGVLRTWDASFVKSCRRAGFEPRLTSLFDLSFESMLMALAPTQAWPLPASGVGEEFNSDLFGVNVLRVVDACYRTFIVHDASLAGPAMDELVSAARLVAGELGYAVLGAEEALPSQSY